MEENSMNEVFEPQNITLDSSAIEHLKETRGWTNFISILGFVFLGLLLIMALAGGAAMARFNPAAAEIERGAFLMIMLIMILIYFFPIYFLYNFSRYSKIAIRNTDQSAFVEAMRYLKLHYRYMGIIMIIICSIYILVFIFALMTGSMIDMLGR